MPISKCLLGYRHVLMLLGLSGLAICYIMRISPAIIILSMVSHNLEEQFNGTQLSTFSDAPKFDWSPMEQNTILSAFFYSYLATQLPAGFMVQHTGGKWAFAVGVTCCGLICIILPACVRAGGFTAFLILRLLQGLFQGMCYPAVHRVVGHWFPPKEYGRLSGLMHSGYLIGTVLALLLSGYLVQFSNLGGWALPFYVYGILAFIWLPLWIIFVSEYPRTHRFISAEEKFHIESSLRAVRHVASDHVPWRRIAGSFQIWLVMACYIMDGWANYTLLVCVPQYIEEVLELPIQKNGLVSSLPYLAAFIFTNLIAPIDGILLSRGIITVTNARKFWSGLSSFGKCALLLVIAYQDASSKITIIVLLVINVMLSSGALFGFNLADLDLAPPYAGLMFSIFNACSTLSGIVAPLVVGNFTTVYPIKLAWRYVFILASAVSCLCGVLYVLFGRPHLLDWVVEISDQLKRDEERETLMTNNTYDVSFNGDHSTNLRHTHSSASMDNDTYPSPHNNRFLMV